MLATGLEGALVVYLEVFGALDVGHGGLEEHTETDHGFGGGEDNNDKTGECFGGGKPC